MKKKSVRKVRKISKWAYIDYPLKKQAEKGINGINLGLKLVSEFDTKSMIRNVVGNIRSVGDSVKEFSYEGSSVIKVRRFLRTAFKVIQEEGLTVDPVIKQVCWDGKPLKKNKKFTKGLSNFKKFSRKFDSNVIQNLTKNLIKKKVISKTEAGKIKAEVQKFIKLCNKAESKFPEALSTLLKHATEDQINEFNLRFPEAVASIENSLELLYSDTQIDMFNEWINKQGQKIGSSIHDLANVLESSIAKKREVSKQKRNAIKIGILASGKGTVDVLEPVLV